MEWNSKPSSLWDLENLFELEAKATENSKKLQRTDCFVEVDRGISSGSLHSPGDGGGSSAGTGGSGSDLGHASSKSSISASINSSSIEESKTSKKFTFNGFEQFQKDLRNENESARVHQPRSSPTPEVSAGSGEPLLSLKLGKRTYFKDISDNNAKSSSLSVASMSSATPAKRSKSTFQSNLIPRCQVEGCNLDLSSAKEYHRKHRICESHSKSPRVIVGGVERRFCQQCSRFHGLSEFDEKKRSCRRRLSDHNARRRKPQPETVRINPARLSSLYDETQKMSLVFDQTPTPRLYTRHAANFAWDHDTDNSKLGHTREYLSRPAKTGAAPGQLFLPNNEMPSSLSMLYSLDTGRLMPNKSTAPEVLHSGLVEESVVSSELNATQDLHRALSLLSTSSWGSTRETKTVSLDACSTTTLTNTNHNNNNSSGSSGMVQPATNTMHQMATAQTQGFYLASEYWQTQQAAINAAPPAPPISHLRSNVNAAATGTHFQDLHLFKPSGDSGFYSYRLN